MTEWQLKAKIRLILSQAASEQLYIAWPNAKSVTGPSQYGASPTVYLPGQATLRSEQVNLLRLMYSQGTEEQKQQFCKLLREVLVELGTRAMSVPASAVAVGHLLADLHCIEDMDINSWVLAGVWSGWHQRLR